MINTTDCYQKVLEQALVPMTLRVGCFNFDPSSRFELHGDASGFLQNLILEIGNCMNQLVKRPVASIIYSDEVPIIRLISRQTIELASWDISSLDNIGIENMSIAMCSAEEYRQPDLPEKQTPVNDIKGNRIKGNSIKDNDIKDNGIKDKNSGSICYSAEVIDAEDHSDFIFKQIASHSDLLIIDASDSNDTEINEFINQNSTINQSSYVMIIRNNGTADFLPVNGSKIERQTNAQALNSKLATELSEILLFDSLLGETSAESDVKSPALQRIIDYAGESSLKYQSAEPDFEYQGPITSQQSWISWHNIFRRFVSWLSPKSDAKSEKKQETGKDNQANSLRLQKASKSCHELFAQFLRADHLAIRYANAHRSSFILIYCLGAFALINAAIAIGFSQIGWLALTSALAEFFALVGIFLIYKNDHKKRYHIKWLEYRSLAEMLRMTPLLNSIGITQSADSFERHRKKHETDTAAGPVNTHNAGRIWLIIYIKSLMRWVGYEQVNINHENLVSAKSFLKETILKSQLSYHKNNAHKMHVVGHNLGHFSYILFVLAFIFVSGKLLTKLLAAMHLGIDYQTLSHVGHGLGVLAAVCPMLGSAAFAIRNHAEFDISSQRSLAMIKNLKQDIDALDNMSQSTQYSELVEQTIKASLVMQSETADWLEIYEVKETEPG